MIKTLRIQCALITAMATASLAAAGDAPLSFSSGAMQVALIELYTSEGCSSCPPADRWMSGLKRDAGLWQTYTPIAFHVDYWDYIGWQDPFADARHSARQRRYAQEGGARAVYTPGFFRSGREWRDWRAGPAPIVDRAPAGDLRLRVDGAAVDVRFEPLDAQLTDLVVHVAVLGMNLETKVEAGENRGRTLRHDFVALGLDSTPLTRGPDGFSATLTLPAAEIAGVKRAVSAWVSREGSQAPLQSVGGFLPTAHGGGGR